MVIKLPISVFELEIGVFRIRDWGFKSPIPNPKNTNPQLKNTNRSFNHKLVISTNHISLRKLGIDQKGSDKNLYTNPKWLQMVHAHYAN